jgi:hypothetical protein
LVTENLCADKALKEDRKDASVFLFKVERYTGCNQPAFGKPAVKCLFDIADIYLYLLCGKICRTNIRVILKDETHLANIIANAANRITTYSHYLL